MSIEAPPSSLNESLDYNDGDGLDARRADADALEALAGQVLAHLEYEERSIAATARRLPDAQFPSEVADSDLPTRRITSD